MCASCRGSPFCSIRRAREDPFERHLGAPGDLVDSSRSALELAEDDLVLTQQDRAEITNVQRFRAGCDALVDLAHDLLADVGPVALSHEAARLLLDHMHEPRSA